eukprot:TRINITY_DN1261_c0_g1_i1.p1 TRINITY_DN1261_c0_g1~~TRINITY_DN1261_c0_g1_i1.p1  ORF type:complete len:996 (-),score=120.87 TRINITY_DN1261_c0_g1_i1:92-3079(-)
MRDYTVEEVLFRVVLDGCTSLDALTQNQYIVNSLTKYYACHDKYYGEYTIVGRLCQSDADCLNRCDHFTGTCADDYREVEFRFFQCFVQNSTLLVKLLLTDGSIDINLPDDELVPLLFEKYSSDQCVGKTTIFELNQYRPVSLFTTITTAINSSVCTEQCPLTVDLYPNAVLPPACQVFNDCYPNRYWIADYSFNLSCSDALDCNWLNCTNLGSLDECKKKCENGPTQHFCGFCDDGFHCREVPGLETEEKCLSAEGCIINKTVSHQDSESCRATKFCTLSCKNNGQYSPCQTQQECEAVGYCDGLGSFGSAGCLVPLQFNVPGWSCPLPNLVIESGCIYRNITNATACRAFSGQWIVPKSITTEEQCRNIGQGCRELNTDTETFTYIFTPKDLDSCVNCDGSYQPYFTWKKGRWLSGETRRLKWVRREYTRFLHENKALELSGTSGIFSAIFQDIQLRYTIATRSNLVCKYSRAPAALQVIACDCATDNSEETCFEQLKFDDIISAAALVCYQETSYVKVSTSRITFLADTLNTKTCAVIRFLSKSIFDFQIAYEESLSSELIDTEETGPSYSFKNDYGAVVGQVVGDGFYGDIGEQGYFFTKFDQFDQIKYCFHIPDIFEYQYDRSKYPIPDLAYVASITDVRPLGYEFKSEVIVGTTYKCGIVKDIKVKDTHVPIYRVSNYQNKRVLTNTEYGLIFALASLYAVVTLYAFYMFLELLILRIRYICIYNVVWILLIMNLIRSITFFLIGADTLRKAPVVIIDILIELPIFIYFSAFILLEQQWARLNTITSAYRRRFEYFWLFSLILGNIIIYMVFIIIIILYETVEDREKRCGGRLADAVGVNGYRTSIALAYRIFIIVTAGILAALFFFFGALLVKKLAGMRQAARRRKKFFWMTTLCCMGLLLLVIYFIIIGKDTEKQNNIVTIVILFFAEVIPSAGILFLIHPGRAYRLDPVSRLLKFKASQPSSSSQQHSNANTSHTPSTPSIQSSLT